MAASLDIGTPQDTCAIIVAGGMGLRFGDARGKQYVEVAGRPVLAWSVQAFAEAPSIGHIVVVCPAGREAETKETLSSVESSVPIVCVAGGETRLDSCLAGLNETPVQFEYVAIHDGARPLIRPESIEAIIAALRSDSALDGAIYAHPATDTLKVVEDGIVQATPERKRYWAVQTPQVFHRSYVLQAELDATNEGFAGTDDASFVEHAGGRVLCVESPADNFKVTVPEDKVPVEAILLARSAGRPVETGHSASASSPAGTGHVSNASAEGDASC